MCLKESESGTYRRDKERVKVGKGEKGLIEGDIQYVKRK